MTAMKLQKLLYYAQAWHLARFGTRAFVEDVEAWARGPVVRSIYREHRKNWAVAAMPGGDASLVEGTRHEVFTWVSKVYGEFSAEQLSAMTHAEVPWLVARQGLPEGAPSETPIDDDLMRDFYSRQTLSPAEAVESAAASAALEGLEIGSDWQQAVMDAIDTPGGVDALIAQRLQEHRAE
jgi:uncharacterized phage-associated protein